ncbi:SUMF1/EgtB/PvdO family nonheme iron enzyme [Caloranaerobacter azorensis]|uniref:Formylglycine-generating enzyme family protein n=1 Tax=Caloranaerobacter azorensis TaxID=116090 RepID=A0A6P1YD57_9FIRM|nr:SUMF1/EgtB/PvdO family nonheme iron enzyme [Caloranaerobacter azorensis]QIB26115.1 formylglycine-generating enzyme family protein [Caloranaerobacter azorensis]
MTNFDDLKLSVEALSGGKNTVLFDDLGMPSIMVPIPKFKLSDVIDGAPQETHPAFIIDGEEKDVIYISKYQNIVINDRAYSLPYKDPRVYVNFDQAVQYCKNKGKGWHLMTNAEWAALALWCKKNGTMPRGNNYAGIDHSALHEAGVKTYDWILDYNWNNRATKFDGAKYHHTSRVATGSGPASWTHNHTNEGIFDLNGNVWEWTGGLRLKNGEIQIIPYNDAAKDISQSDTSTFWKAITPDGTLVTPGTPGTLKIDNTTAGSSAQDGNDIGGDPIINTIRENPIYTGGDTNAYYRYSHCLFETLSVKSGVSVPMILKALGIYPIDSQCGGDGLWVRNYGERLCLRGGGWGGGSGAGVFALSLGGARSGSGGDVGFRAAYVG